MRNVFVIILLVAVGCGLDPGGAYNGGGGGATIGGSPSTTSSTNEDATDQSAQQLCPSTSSLLAGAHPAGDVCSVPSDCVSTCCDCGTGGTYSWLAASCVAGHCVDGLSSCSRTSARYCGDGG